MKSMDEMPAKDAEARIRAIIKEIEDSKHELLNLLNEFSDFSPSALAVLENHFLDVSERLLDFKMSPRVAINDALKAQAGEAPLGDDRWRCANCGEVSGMLGHSVGMGGFFCEKVDLNKAQDSLRPPANDADRSRRCVRWPHPGQMRGENCPLCGIIGK